MKGDPPDKSVKTVKEDKILELEEFHHLDVDSLTESEIQSNIDEISMEVDTLESILMSEVSVHDDFYPTVTVQTSQGPSDLIVYRTITLQVFPEESIPTKLTKITSERQESDGTDETEVDEKVRVKISSMENLPSFSIKILLPVSYPSLTPPLFVLPTTGIYKNWECVICDKFEQIYRSESDPCIYDWYTYLQCDFVNDYKSTFGLEALSLTVTSDKEYEEVQGKSRDTLRYQLGRKVNTCMICFESYYGEDLFVITGCQHFFCKGCLKFYCENLINQGKVVDIKCPDMK